MKRISSDITADEEQIPASILEDIAGSNIVLLQMADYNVFRLRYGFSDFFLKMADEKEQEMPNNTLIDGSDPKANGKLR